MATAAILGVIEYKTSNDDRRSERSMKIVRDWQGTGMIDRYARVQSFVESKFQTRPGDLPPEARRAAHSNLATNGPARYAPALIRRIEDLRPTLTG